MKNQVALAPATPSRRLRSQSGMKREFRRDFVLDAPHKQKYERKA